ncbi:50S ribosomal protein L13 [Candidatus Micrarchaeota archaeon]|nr:50S ribosomal protein L13 [Candidatus Micrarchaeota archaeon]MBD3418082.1 50S ribosomal protein L13 [Candidatus Micrarchaeota archaeon]
MIVIDAGNARIGRVGTFVAKKLLEGEEIQVINAEEAVISGDPQKTLERYIQRRQFQFKGNPEKSPYWPKVPDRFVKRLIRGMLPRKKASGRNAYKNLKVHIGKPAEIKGEPIRVEGADAGRLNRYIKVSELCRKLGYESR